MERVFSFMALLLIASVIPSNVLGAGEEAGAAEGEEVLWYDVGRNLSLLCPLALDKGAVYLWKKNGTSVEEQWDVKERYKLEEGGARFRIVGRSHEDDFGNYSCSAAGGGAEHAWDVRGRPVARLPANTNVVEGQKLKLTCKVTGKPYPAVTWLYSNSTEEDAGPGAELDEAALAGRGTLAASEAGVARAELVLAAARREDAGRYSCRALTSTADTVLRVKDMYAALWPFLGICAEVFVLCAVILVYERRRTKPENDDSDTDNHDQKKS